MKFVSILLEMALRFMGLCLPNASNEYINTTDDAEYFDINYTKQAEANINDEFFMFMMMHKEWSNHNDVGHDGLRSEHDVELTYPGGVAWGTPGTPRSAEIQKATLDHKELFATAYASAATIQKTRRGKKVSHGSIMDVEVKQKIMNSKRQIEIALHGYGDGRLGTAGGATPTGTAAAPVVIMAETDWCPFRWEKKDIVNVGSAGDNYEVTNVNRSTRAITFKRLDGLVDLTSGALSSVFYLQHSKDQAWHGTAEILAASAGSKYGIAIGDRWQSTQYTATGSISPSMLRQRAMDVKNLTGQFPTMIECSTKQFNSLMVFADSLKEIQVKARRPHGFDEAGNVVESDSNPYYADLGFEAMALAVPGKKIPIVYSRFLEDARTDLLNTNKIKLKLTMDGLHWLKNGSDVWLRIGGTKFYEALYYGLGNVYINPLYQAQILGLP